MTTHEAVLGGARWRLTLHPDGRWEVAKFSEKFRLWDEPLYAGNRGIAGVRDSAKDIQVLGAILIKNEAGDLAASILHALADVAERNTT